MVVLEGHFDALKTITFTNPAKAIKLRCFTTLGSMQILVVMSNSAC